MHTAKKRLERQTAIEKLGTIMEMRVNPDYHALRVAELELTADFQMKVQEEREKALVKSASCFASNVALRLNSLLSGNALRRSAITT